LTRLFTIHYFRLH